MPVAKGYGRDKIRDKRRKKIAICIILVGLILLLPFFFFNLQIRPAIQEMAQYQTSAYVTNTINETISEELSQSNYSYDSLVNISHNDQQQITSIEADTLKINRLHTAVTQRVNQVLTNMQETKIYIPLGNLLNIPFFSGFGPDIPITVIPKGYVHTQIISDLSEAGINQTVHRLTIHIEANIATIIPTCSREFTVSMDYPLAETVIVGSVPGFYAEVLTESNQEIQSKTPEN